MSTDESPEPRTLADKVNHLFEHVKPPGSDRPYSHKAVADAIAESGGPTISVGYISEIRNGVVEDVRLSHLQALADFFGVDPSYFVDDRRAAEIDSQLRLLSAMRDNRIRDLALRYGAGEIDTATLDAISEIIEDNGRRSTPER